MGYFNTLCGDSHKQVTFYQSIIFAIFILLASLSAGTLNQQLVVCGAISTDCVKVGDLVPFGKTKDLTADELKTKFADHTVTGAYTRCVLNASSSDFTTVADSTPGCVLVAGEWIAKVGDVDAHFKPTVEDNTLESLFVISVTAAVINGLLLLQSLLSFVLPDKFLFTCGSQKMLMLSNAIVSLVNIGLFSGLVGWMNLTDNLQSEANVKNNLYFIDVDIFATAVAGVVIAVLDCVLSSVVILKCSEALAVEK